MNKFHAHMTTVARDNDLLLCQLHHDKEILERRIESLEAVVMQQSLRILALNGDLAAQRAENATLSTLLEPWQHDDAQAEMSGGKSGSSRSEKFTTRLQEPEDHA
jgi:hypothetical protein